MDEAQKAEMVALADQLDAGINRTNSRAVMSRVAERLRDLAGAGRCMEHGECFGGKCIHADAAGVTGQVKGGA